jgi:hypothetical protein
MNARFYNDLDADGLYAVAGYSDRGGSGFSLWSTLWAFAEAMWLTGHDDDDGG